jgi:hypothetical protein
MITTRDTSVEAQRGPQMLANPAISMPGSQKLVYLPIVGPDRTVSRISMIPLEGSFVRFSVPVEQGAD